MRCITSKTRRWGKVSDLTVRGSGMDFRKPLFVPHGEIHKTFFFFPIFIFFESVVYWHISVFLNQSFCCSGSDAGVPCTFQVPNYRQILCFVLSAYPFRLTLFSSFFLIPYYIDPRSENTWLALGYIVTWVKVGKFVFDNRTQTGAAMFCDCW